MRKIKRKDQNRAIWYLVRWYLKVYMPSNGAAQNTIRNCTRTLNDLSNWGIERDIQMVSELNMTVIQEFMTDHYADLKGSSRRLNMTIIRAWINACYQSERIDTIPVRHWEMPKSGRESVTPRALKPEEIHEILRILGEHDKPLCRIISFIAHTGVRQSDAFDLRWGQIDWEYNVIERTLIKTKNFWQFPLTALLVKILQPIKPEIINPDAYVFLYESQPCEHQIIYTRMRSLLKKHGFCKVISTKVFRISYATIGANNGVPPKVLQRCLGHTDIKTTLNFYTETTLENVRSWQDSIVSAFD